MVDVHKSMEMNDLNELLLLFTLSIYSSKLTNIHHYNSQQQLLYDEVKYLREEIKLSYKEISNVLGEKGYLSVRSKKKLLPNYVFSIYKKGKIRENRINKEFDNYYFDLTLIDFK